MDGREQGSHEGDLAEAIGDLKAGDMVVHCATSQMRDGTTIRSR
jgi:hypothetical protein